MRILLTTPSFKGGGITSYSHELINAYAEEHSLYVMIADDSYCPIDRSKATVLNQNISDISRGNILKIFRQINDDIQPDIIINNCSPVCAILSPYFKDTIKIISVSHSLKFSEARGAAYNHAHVNKIVCLSEAAASYMMKHYHVLPSSKIEVIPNFVKECSNADSLREQKLRNTTLNIVFPGGCAGSKSPELVLRILRGLIKTKLNFRFYWLGNRTIHLSRHFPFLGLGDIANMVDRDSRVVFTGRVSRQEAENYISNCNIFLLPSRREGSPMSLLEAMRVGAVCIVADYKVANSEIIRDRINGFVLNHKNPDDFISLIDRIIRTHEKYESYYCASYNSFVEHYTRRNWMARMDSLLHGLSSENVIRYKSPSFFALTISILRYRTILILEKIKVSIQEDLYILLTFFKLKKYA